MSTLEAKPVKINVLNSKLLPIAAILLIVLALLFMATPLLRTSRGFQRNSINVRQGSGPTVPQNGFPNPANGLQGQGNGSQGQGSPNFQNRQFSAGGGSSLGSIAGFLGGITGAIVFFLTLLISLAAAMGMFFTKRWGQVLGIVMAVLYLLAGLISLLPTLLLGSFIMRNPLSLILGFAHVLLALAVIVLASIPAKKATVPVIADPPPAASA
jgi:hypothetical protein